MALAPVERAAYAQQFVEMGMPLEKVLAVFGWKKAQLDQHLKLLDLDAKVLAAVEKGTVKVSAAAQLAKLERKEQREKLDELTADGGKATVARARKAAQGGNAPAASRGPGKAAIRVVAARIRERALEDHSFALALMWVLGDLSVDDVAADLDERMRRAFLGEEAEADAEDAA